MIKNMCLSRSCFKHLLKINAIIIIYFKSFLKTTYLRKLDSPSFQYKVDLRNPGTKPVFKFLLQQVEMG